MTLLENSITFNRIIICDAEEDGFEAKLREYVDCLKIAAETNRTYLTLKDKFFTNTNASIWTNFFTSTTNCSYAKHIDVKEIVNFKSAAKLDVFLFINKDARVIKVPLKKYSHLAEKPLTIPSQFSRTLFQHHSNPSAFFTAQFTWYLWKLNESLRKNIEESKAKIQFSKGLIIGIQILKIHWTLNNRINLVEEHIKWAEYWFRVKEIQLNKLVQRRIFIATDDLAVINETKTKYPNYDIHGDEQLSKIKDLKTNDIKELLEKSISDINLLSECDYIICTTNSSECLTAYSLMQISKGDMDDHYVSLDYIEKFRIKIQDHVLLANDSNNSFSINENYNTTTKVHSPIDSSEGYNNQTINSTEFSSSFMAKEKHEIVEFPPF